MLLEESYNSTIMEDKKISEMIDKSLIHEKEGEERGTIKDIGAAQELAYIEKSKGVDAALAREKELAEGLTEVQKENLKAIELLPGKYPHAFIPDSDGTPIKVDNKGRQYLVTRPIRDKANAVITQEGVCFVSMSSFDTIAVREDVASQIDLSLAVDAAAGRYPSSAIHFELKNDKDISIAILGDTSSVRDKAPQLKDLLLLTEEDYQGLKVGPQKVSDISELL